MKKAAKLALALLVLAVGGLIAFAGASPQAYRTPGDLLAEPGAYEGRVVEVKAAVREGSVTRAPVTFVLEDGRAALRVEWVGARPLPEDEAGGTVEGRTAVVTGTLARAEDGGWVLRATEMAVGCASKYEPVAPEA